MKKRKGKQWVAMPDSYTRGFVSKFSVDSPLTKEKTDRLL